MNKKVSTILTCGLMLGSSLLASSAFAQTTFGSNTNLELKTTVSDGQKVVLVVNNGHAIGFQKSDERNPVITPLVDPLATPQAGLNNYLWTVKVFEPEVTGGIYSYQFINAATGDTLKFNKGTNALVTSADATTTAYKDNGGVYKTFKFGTTANGGDKAYNGGNWQLFPVGGGDVNRVHPIDGTPDNIVLDANSNDTQYITFYDVKSTEAIDEMLNALFNRKGFSFEVNKEVEENIFANRIKAINVEEVVSADETTTTAGYPKGVYFATSTPDGEYPKSANDAEKYEYLSQCTFVVVASNDCVELSGLDRANGQGFKLIEVKGSELDHYIGNNVSEQASNDEISVWNACFTVKTKSTESFPYSICLDRFYYVADADDMAEAMANNGIYRQEEASVNLEVLDHSSANYLTTSKNTSNAAPFIFKFDDSNAISGISLLKTDRTAAVYNIRFVSGADDDTELNKYLTVGDVVGDKENDDKTDNNSFGWVAKGETYANAESLATPVYQFVITAVNGNNVTFTNRESGVSFTTQLFEEGELNGRPVYSLALSNGNENLSVVNVDVNSYATTVDADQTKLSNTEVQLIPSTVDSYAGFLNVDDGTLMTMKFARDINTTSNLWYAGVNDKFEMTTTGGSTPSNKAVLAEDLFSAAQWQLVAVDSVKLRRDYVYNSSNSVQEVPYGDVIVAKTYTLEYVTDGSAQDKYLAASSGVFSLANNDNATFIIRENVNGSVEVILYRGNTNNCRFDDKGEAFTYNTKASGHLTLSANKNYYGYEPNGIYDVDLDDHELLTYMINESAEISWPGEEGHVTIQSAGSDYLTIDTDNNEAVIIDEANADPFYLHVTDKDAIVPSFYISKGMGEGSTAESERMFLFNPQDSITYQVNMDYDPKYQMSEETVKAIFKSGIMDESRDTLALTVKGEVDKLVAVKSNNQNVWGGLNRFKFQIIETADHDGYYNIRQIKTGNGSQTYYLANINDNAVWVDSQNKMVPRYDFVVEGIDAPTANEGVSATEVKVIAVDGAINIKNAAGKNVVVSTILGQIVANEVLTSDNATISVPAGIAIVSVDGEEAVKVSVR